MNRLRPANRRTTPQDDGGWLQEMPLLDRLVTKKLKAEAETIAAEGWKWIEVATGFPYGYDDDLRRLEGTPADITAEKQATIDALQAEQAKLEAEYQDAGELPDEVDVRLGEIEKALSAFDNRPHIYDPAEVARAGAFVSIDSDGTILVERGFVRPEDEAPVDQAEGNDGDLSDGTDPSTPSTQRTVITVGGRPETEDEEEDDGIKPLPDRLVMELTAHRTLAMRDAVANNPHVAMTRSAQALRRHILQRLCARLYPGLGPGRRLSRRGVDRNCFLGSSSPEWRQIREVCALVSCRRTGLCGGEPCLW